MEKRTITKTGAKGARFDYHFLVDEDNGTLQIEDVKVLGESIMEVIDVETLEGVWLEQYQKWINKAA